MTTLKINHIFIFQTFNFVVGMWCLSFISALNDLYLAGVYGTWYWTRNKKNVSYLVMVRSATRALYYHSGTAALSAAPLVGRLIIGVFFKGKSHSLRTQALNFFLDKWKPSHRNPHVLCAIHGTGFNDSVFDAIQLMTGHVQRSIVFDTVTNYVFMICKCVVYFLAAAFAVLSFACFYCVFSFAAGILAIVGAYIIFNIFFSAYSVAVNTIVLCIRE